MVDPRSETKVFGSRWRSHRHASREAEERKRRKRSGSIERCANASERVARDFSDCSNRGQSQVRWNLHPSSNCMHTRSPVLPSLQMTPISGLAWHSGAFGSLHGVVLGGGAQTV